MDLSGSLTGLLSRSVFPVAGTSVVCAVSGGADSLALLALAAAAELRVTAVHVDHGLRPESSAEAQVVAVAAERFGADFRSERLTLADGPNLEARARDARRSILGEGALTGHTLDDQAETVLINLIRGAGLDGLAAMSPGGIHPILGLRRAETHALCAELRLEPVRDASNDDPRFVRNRLRHEVLPLLNEISGRDVVPLLSRTSDTARAAAEVLEALARDLDPTSTKELRAVAPPVAHVALRRWLRLGPGTGADDGQASGEHPPSTADLERVMAVVRHEVIACEISGGRRVSRHQGVLRVGPARPGQP